MDDFVGEPDALLGELLARLVRDLHGALDAPAEPVGLRELHGDGAPGVLVAVLLERLDDVAGVLLAHELERLLLVPEPLAVVVVAAREVVAERLLVEVRVERGCRGVRGRGGVAAHGGGRAAPGPAVAARGRGGRREQRGAERRRDGRHRGRGPRGARRQEEAGADGEWAASARTGPALSYPCGLLSSDAVAPRGTGGIFRGA